MAILEHARLLRHLFYFITQETRPLMYRYMKAHRRTYKGNAKFSRTRYRALGPDLIPVYRSLARR